MSMLESEKSEEHGKAASGIDGGMPKASGVGTLLRNEREKRGWSLKEVAEVTRLRVHVIEALENEDWKSLPPPVFIKGFIRSYARTLGLDHKAALELYGLSGHVDSTTPRILPISPGTGKRKLALLLVLLAAAAALFFLRQVPRSPSPANQPGREAPPPVKREAPAPAADLREGEDGESKGEPETREQADRPEAAVAPLPPTDPVLSGLTMEPAIVPAPESGETELPRREDLETPAPERESGMERHVLTAEVQERTWVRICIDDQGPKEYIFQPGSRPQWQAEKGFHVIIGNAGGILFDYNGRQQGTLGRRGEVVRLRFPEGFRAPLCEE
ncbi:MAG: DUF4115 domain-containing protein [Deltaproteobacteria bacterium]|nr:DUF4115 domain-containing protein [Deltaproteobacteria bacterium]